MPRRSIWRARQRAALFDLPTDEAALLRHYTLLDDIDISGREGMTGWLSRSSFAPFDSPLGWAHILLIGEHRWAKRR